MIRRHTLTVFAAAFLLLVGNVSARADMKAGSERSAGKLAVTPAVLTTDGEASAPITEVQYYRRAYRRGYYGYPNRSYGYGYGYGYPRYSYGYYPRYSYGSYPYGYAYSRPYYSGYYPRYYSGYRGGFSYAAPGFYGSFYW